MPLDAVFGVGDSADDPSSQSPFPETEAFSPPPAKRPRPDAEKGGDGACADDMIVVRRRLPDPDAIRRRQTLADPAALADGLRVQLIEDSCKVRDELLICPPPAPLALTACAAAAGGALVVRDAMAVAVTAAGGALAVRDAMAVAVAAQDAMVNPVAPRRPAGVGDHVCALYCPWDPKRPHCTFRRATDLCGMRGCTAISLLALQEVAPFATRAQLSAVRPQDVWVCVESGRPHPCTRYTCDSLEPDSQGSNLVCGKTGIVYDKIAVPTGDSVFGFMPSRDAELQSIADYVSSLISAPAPAPASAPAAPAAKRRKTRSASSQTQPQRDKVTGMTAAVVAAALTAGGGGDAAIARRWDDIRRAFSRPAPAAVIAAAEPCLARAVEMAAAAVVQLPVFRKCASALSRARQAECARRYGALAWRAWTLAASVPGAADAYDADLKFRHFCLGALYHAKDGVALKMDLRSVALLCPEFSGRGAEVAAAARAALDAADRRRQRAPRQRTDDECLDAFGRRHEIVFMVSDPELESRLVPENLIGTRNSTVDGVRVDGVSVTSGMKLVKSGLCAVAEWSKREFVTDVLVRGVGADAAAQSADVRAADFLIWSNR